MNAVIYFSCTGRSKAVAKKAAAKLDWDLLELTADTQRQILQNEYANAVIVFPVHCQSYPKPMKNFFGNLRATNAALVATYGSANAGNAVYEAAKLLKNKPVAAAYVPCNHSYSHKNIRVAELPQQFYAKLFSPSAVDIPKRKKTAFAGFLPSLRSRIIITVKRGGSCTNCGKCTVFCPVSAIDCGRTNSRCIRCLKCVYSCPNGALEIKKKRVLERYLKSARCEDLILYL